ncbi:hypothetical protein, partial [Achromobacter marplatensis]|uniref:hypothetical protein n=1 Tax=Achromobacter marplatensis TaxID=470868 RepID=UPI000277F4A6
MTENNAAQPGLTDDQIEALAKKHICPHHDRLDAVLPNRVPYQQTEQFRRVKALIGDVLSKLRAEGVHAGEPVADEHEAKQVAKWKRSSELLDAVQDGCWDVRFLSSPNGDAGDFSIGVEIVSHFMAAPRERVIGENWNENLRAAIEQAMTADGYPPARPERASAPVAGEAQPTDEQILNIADRVWREHEQVPTDKSAVLALVREVLGKAPVADESPMAKMADALREKGRQEQQAYQDSRVQSTEWGPMPHGTEAD